MDHVVDLSVEVIPFSIQKENPSKGSQPLDSEKVIYFMETIKAKAIPQAHLSNVIFTSPIWESIRWHCIASLFSFRCDICLDFKGDLRLIRQICSCCRKFQSCPTFAVSVELDSSMFTTILFQLFPAHFLLMQICALRKNPRAIWKVGNGGAKSEVCVEISNKAADPVSAKKQLMVLDIQHKSMISKSPSTVVKWGQLLRCF